MGIVESKLEHALDANETNLCCTQNRKDRCKERKVNKNSVDRNESVEMALSVFTPWIPQPEQKEASHDAVLEKSVDLHYPLRMWVSSKNFSSDFSTSPREKEAKPSELPYGWTTAQITNLKDAVRNTASVRRIKRPSFFTVQVSL
jgi:hypothetical protein